MKEIIGFILLIIVLGVISGLLQGTKKKNVAALQVNGNQQIRRGLPLHSIVLRQHVGRMRLSLAHLWIKSMEQSLKDCCHSISGIKAMR